jgi:hypothetical protein
MRTIMLATAAALLLAQSAGAVTQPKDPRDMHGQPVLPADPVDRPPLAETPNRQAAPEQEAKEAELRKDLEAWRERVETWRREHEAKGGKEDAAKLEQALQDAEQSWRRLAQSDAKNWENAMHQVESTRDKLARVWEEAND